MFKILFVDDRLFVFKELRKKDIYEYNLNIYYGFEFTETFKETKW